MISALRESHPTERGEITHGPDHGRFVDAAAIVANHHLLRGHRARANAVP
jgi:hypothetical protein